MKTLETERLILRSFLPGDLEQFHAYAKRMEVGPAAGWRPHLAIEETAEVLANFIKEDNVFAIVDKVSLALIGSIGIYPDYLRPTRNDSKMLGYGLQQDFWNRGLMTEVVAAVLGFVFEEMKCMLVSVCHYTENRRSRRVIEKNGFRYEGEIRGQMLRFDNKLFDSCVYSMTKREYLQNKAKKLGLYFVLSEELDKEQYLAYYEEWQETGKDFIPIAGSLKDMSYDEWKEVIRLQRTVTPAGFVKNTTFFLTDSSRYIYGIVNIRHMLNERLQKSGGHIGYGIRPSMRRKGYGEIQLAMAIEQCKLMGINRAMLVCDDTNIASAAVIEHNGGVLEDKLTAEDGCLIRRYWVDTD